MVTTGIDFCTRQSNGPLLIFDTWIKPCCDNEQIAVVRCGAVVKRRTRDR